jgi:quinol monooxygenase YgiN
MVTVIATIIAKKEKIAEVKAGLLDLVAYTTKEEGCIQYTLHQDKDEPHVFVFYEQFKDQEAFDFHASQSYIVSFGVKIPELMEKPPKLRFVEKV